MRGLQKAASADEGFGFPLSPKQIACVAGGRGEEREFRFGTLDLLGREMISIEPKKRARHHLAGAFSECRLAARITFYYFFASFGIISALTARFAPRYSFARAEISSFLIPAKSLTKLPTQSSR